MSHVLTPQSPLSSMRRAVARLWSDPNSRSILIGLAAVLLVHLFLFATAPYLLRSDPAHPMPRAAAPRQFSIEIAPDAFSKPVPKPPPPTRFVESNPNAPDNAPDKTNNFSNRNSQLAQEKPQADQHNDTPKLDGKKDIQSNQVVSGLLSKPQETAPAVPDPSKAQKAKSAMKQMQNPLSGFEKSTTADDGFGSNLGTVPDQAKPVPNKIDGTANSQDTPGTDSDQPAIDPKHPRSRPMINNLQTRPAVFKDNQFGTSNIGPIAFDAKWSNYGAYLHKMIEAIQIQWDRILIESRTEPPSGSTVTVKFTLDSKGKITEIIDVESTSSEQGKQSCVSAITLTAPYGDWTDDMIAILGNSQQLTFVFYYE